MRSKRKIPMRRPSQLWTQRPDTRNRTWQLNSAAKLTWVPFWSWSPSCSSFARASKYFRTFMRFCFVGSAPLASTRLATARITPLLTLSLTSRISCWPSTRQWMSSFTPSEVCYRFTWWAQTKYQSNSDFRREISRGPQKEVRAWKCEWPEDRKIPC